MGSTFKLPPFAGGAKLGLVTVELGHDARMGKRRRAYLSCVTKREAEREEARLKDARQRLTMRPFRTSVKLNKGTKTAIG